jgi:hypothetical protein
VPARLPACLPAIPRCCCRVQALVLSPTRELATQTEKNILAVGDHMNVQAHGCIGGKSIGDDIRKLENGVHIVSGTPGRVFDMIKRRSLRTRCGLQRGHSSAPAQRMQLSRRGAQIVKRRGAAAGGHTAAPAVPRMPISIPHGVWPLLPCLHLPTSLLAHLTAVWWLPSHAHAAVAAACCCPWVQEYQDSGAG